MKNRFLPIPMPLLDKFAYGYCRLCGHFKHLHQSGGLECRGWVNFVLGTHGTCTCTEYVPEDNLEYFKYKYDQLKIL